MALHPRFSTIAFRAGICCLGVLLTTAVRAADSPEVTVHWTFGWDGIATVGRWSAARAEFTLPGPAECQLEVAASDAEGHTASFVSPVQSVPAGFQQLVAYFQCGRLDCVVRARLIVNGVPQSTLQLRPGAAAALKPLSRLSDRIIVTAGLPIVGAGPLAFDELARQARSPSETAVHVIALKSPSELPKDALGYSSVHWLVIGGDAAVPPDVSEALREWVADGGRLVLSVPKDLSQFQSSPLHEWLPMEIGSDPVAVLNLGELEALAGRSIRIPTTGRQLVARLKLREGVALASSRDEPLLVRAPYGFGDVTVLALDITQPPLLRWNGLRDFGRNLLEVPAETAANGAKTSHRAGQLASTGVSDLASQSHAALEHFPQVRRPSPAWSMVWVLALLVLVGPVDYLIVHRLLRRPHLTWITLPMLLIVTGTFAVRSGEAWNTSQRRWNQLDVVDIEPASRRVRQHTWGTLYSPDTTTQDLALSGPLHGWNSDARVEPTARVSWSAIPETAFGGMYRPAGTEWNRTEYRVFPHNTRIDKLPTLQWSSRSLHAAWSGEGPVFVETDLESSGLGRLTGSLTHRLPAELTDWILAHGNRAYRRQPSRDEEVALPLRPDERWSLDDSHTFQRELRGVLTRSVVFREIDREKAASVVLHTAQSRYDPLHRDLHAIWELLTFHEAAGGTGYSTLGNHLLNAHDLSRQLELGRAVLFGRLNVPPAAAAQRDGSPLQADRHDVFVRIVLPVRRTGAIVRDLPKFDREK